MLTPETLTAAGWRLTTERGESSYGLTALLAPDGGAVGDLDLVSVRADGTLCDDLFSGRLITGAEVRALLAGDPQ